MVYNFVPQSETTEIVVQISNFVHRIGGEAPVLTIGTANNVFQKDRLSTFRMDLIGGALLIIGLYHIAVFILNRRQVASLAFDLSCLLQLVVSVNLPPLLFPDMSWLLAMRMEYVCFVSLLCILVVLIGMLYPNTLYQ